MHKTEYETYVAISPNGKYYNIETEWCPEGEYGVIRETTFIECAYQFESSSEIFDLEKAVASQYDSNSFSFGNFEYYSGEFKPEEIKQIKITRTYEIIKDVHIF